jgi:hypothetical protein
MYASGYALSLVKSVAPFSERSFEAADLITI